MSSRAERREKARKRREEVKDKIISIISNHLPECTANASKEELDAGLKKGFKEAQAWIADEIKKNPQESSLVNDGVNMALKFLENTLHQKV